MNPYKVLQVDPSAEPEVIEGAYRRLAAKYHPDKNPSASAATRLKAINAAYDVLRDADRRAHYDAHAASVRPPASEPLEEVAPEAVSRYRGPMRRVVRVTLALGIAAGVVYFFHERSEAERNKEEVAALDLPTLLGVKLDDFTRSCVAKEGQKSPDVAAAYCSCLAERIRTRFDMSPVNVDTVEEYKRAVASRFAVALPGEDAQAGCREQVQPRSR